MPKTNSLNDALRASAQAEARPAAAPERRAAPNGATKLVGAHFPEAVHRKLRVLSAQEGRTLQAVLAEALNDLFAKRKLPPIA